MMHSTTWTDSNSRSNLLKERCLYTPPANALLTIAAIAALHWNHDVECAGLPPTPLLCQTKDLASRATRRTCTWTMADLDDDFWEHLNIKSEWRPSPVCTVVWASPSCC
jgi:hypothetical protein